MPVQVVDLFCGVGGLTRGLLNIGLNVVAGFDIDPTCRFTYEHNNHVDYHLRNIREVIGEEGERNMISYLLGYAQVCRHVRAVSVLSECICVCRLEYEVGKCRISRFGLGERMYVSVQVRI